MKFIPIPGECTRCGAPLTQSGNHLFCEYCGKKYAFLSSEAETDVVEEGDQEALPPDTEEKPSSIIEQPQEENTATESVPSHHSIATYIRYILILLSLILIFNIIFNPSWTVMPDKALHQASKQGADGGEDGPPLIQSILINDYDALKLPSASNEDLPVANAVIMEYAGANYLAFSLYVYNQSDEDIDTSLVERHLEIINLSVTSNLQDVFSCSFNKGGGWNKHTLRTDEIKRKGEIICEGSLSPQASSLDIDFEMPNWGISHLSMSLPSREELLEPKIRLHLGHDGYEFKIDFEAAEPQLVWVNKSDILIEDDHGNRLPLEGCSFTSEHGKGDYFLTLVSPDFYHFYQENELLTCKPEGHFPEDVNTMNATLTTTTGKTFSLEAVVDKSDGWIHFSNRSNEETDRSFSKRISIR